MPPPAQSSAPPLVAKSIQHLQRLLIHVMIVINIVFALVPAGSNHQTLSIVPIVIFAQQITALLSLEATFVMDFEVLIFYTLQSLFPSTCFKIYPCIFVFKDIQNYKMQVKVRYTIENFLISCTKVLKCFCWFCPFLIQLSNKN